MQIETGSFADINTQGLDAWKRHGGDTYYILLDMVRQDLIPEGDYIISVSY